MNAEKSGDWFRQIIELAPNPLVLVDATGRIALINAETERLFGYAREALIGQSVEILVPEPMREHHPHERAAFLAAPQTRAMGAEVSFRSGDAGTEVVLRV